MYSKDKKIKDIDLMYAGERRPSTELGRVCNYGGTKPEGGLWTSPKGWGEKSVWQEWCEKEGYNTKYYKKSWHIVPHDDCKILVVDADLSNVEDYLIKGSGGLGDQVLDFEKISSDYDAVYFPKDAVSLYNYRGCLRGYDVESCLFLKPKYDVMDDEEYRAFCNEEKRKVAEENIRRLVWEMDNPRQAISREVRWNKNFFYQPKVSETEKDDALVEGEENASSVKIESSLHNKDLENVSAKQDDDIKDRAESTELSDKEMKKRAMLRRIAKLNVSKEKGVVNPKRSNLEKAYLVMIDKLKNR